MDAMAAAAKTSPTTAISQSVDFFGLRLKARKRAKNAYANTAVTAKTAAAKSQWTFYVVCAAARTPTTVSPSSQRTVLGTPRNRARAACFVPVSAGAGSFVPAVGVSRPMGSARAGELVHPDDCSMWPALWGFRRLGFGN